MAIKPDGGPAPYAPPSAVIGILDAFRERGLQTPFTAETLVRTSLVTEALANRTLAALQLLEFIDKEGKPTESMNALRLAPGEDFADRLAEHIRDVYAPVFAFTDPAIDSPDRVRDAFRVYEPIGQQGRMVTLFLGLCERAGIRPSGQKRQGPAAAAPSRQRPAQRPQRQATGGGKAGSAVLHSTQHMEGVPAAIAAQVGELPKMWPGWSEEQRKAFLAAFGALLNLYFPAPTSGTVSNSDEQEGGDE